ncbi:MAG: ABC transporter ATP-binding protein [Hyphomicrobiales bacterium]
MEQKAQTQHAVLAVRGLNVCFGTLDGEVHAVKSVDLDVGEGENVAIVGKSGSGKSQIILATMGILAANGHATGSVRFRGEELLGLSKRMLNHYRGKRIAMIFQEPMTSLDPLYTVGCQIGETLTFHSTLRRREIRGRVLELLGLARLRDPQRIARSYPHELSGGQRQRAMIAMALANEPDILIADEPTTALDVTIQAEILALLADLQNRLGMSILFITHDLGIVREFADRVYVMAEGEMVETGRTQRLFDAPREAYTKMLLAAEPEGRKAPPPALAPILLQGCDVRVTYRRGGGFLRNPRHELRAIDGISITLRKGQTIGVVGESGSGKSTLGRALLRLVRSNGRIIYAGRRIEGFDRDAMRPLRRQMQIVFQDPFGSLSPRMTVGEIVAEGLTVHEPQLRPSQRVERVVEALAKVQLDPALRNRYPHEFSGGQRQRIAIARAMILKPDLVVLDEPTSALDRLVQKHIVELLRDIQAENDLSYIFISHDLAVVRAMADYIIVMRLGSVVEEGSVGQIFDHPRESYTRELIAATLNPAGHAVK